MMNFSLNYRHLPENNIERYKMIMCISIKVGERRGIRVMIFEHDNMRELAGRLMSYFYTSGSLYLPVEYGDYMLQSL